MKYDFESIIDRKGRDALAVDLIGAPGSPYPAAKEGFDPIPMWIADMNFAVPPAIQQAVTERTAHPCFGYFDAGDEYYNAIIDWQSRRNGVTGLTRKAIGYENGVLGGVISALNVLCSRGDSVLVHSPTYIGFTMSLKNNGYDIVHSPLKPDADGVFRMDFEDMERKIVEKHIHAMIMCSPHNPTGRVWERGELEQVAELCRKHDVFIVCDEIWSDIILGGNRHIPMQSVSDDARQRTVALYAPSKTFNLAGLVGSYHIIYNSWLRDRVRKEASLSHYNSMNVLWMHALTGAYRPEGHEWLEQLREVLTRNAEFAVGFIRERFKGVSVSMPQGTYMLFLDCTQWCGEHGKSIDELLAAGHAVGVYWQDGRQFEGPCHIRMNLASPEARIREAFGRLDRYVFK